MSDWSWAAERARQESWGPHTNRTHVPGEPITLTLDEADVRAIVNSLSSTAGHAHMPMELRSQAARAAAAVAPQCGLSYGEGLLRQWRDLAAGVNLQPEHS